MVKRRGVKLPKLSVPSLGGLTKNKYVLYILLVIGLVNVVSYLQTNNLDSLGLFVVSGVLTTFFTKNMIVALAVAIAMGMCKTCATYVPIGSLLEGMENEDEEDDEDEEEEDGIESFYGGSYREGFKEGNMAKSSNKKKAGKSAKGNKCKKRYVQSKKGGKCKEVCKKDYKDCGGNGKKKAYKCYNDQRTCKKQEKKESFSKYNVPSSEPASLDGGDEAGGDRIDYAATLEMAYDNLDKMLGKKGMAGLTKETSKLAKQQKGLMESLKNMAPIMNNAKATLESMNLPEINKMAKMMGNINQGKRAN
tara:strand:+ start:1008 stop:1925 length:918 start_codon:yes stop_codon:yes gene_type:complete